MVAEFLVNRTVLAAIVGVLVSFVIERGAQPHPQAAWRRASAALRIHLGIWLLAYIGVLAAFRRPWFAAATIDALLLGLVLVNNAKVASLKEAFVFQDFEYFTDALRHPRLYIPFFGLWRLAAAVAGIAGAVVGGLTLEPTITRDVSGEAFALMLMVLAMLAAILLLTGQRGLADATYDPEADLRSFGLLSFLWRYGLDEQRDPAVPALQPLFASGGTAEDALRPDLIAIQSESFFDPRRHFPGIKSAVLTHFDALKASAHAQGPLQVAAWGANTVRTEFAFLSGIDPRHLGVHRFNPYRRVARRPIPTVASYLRGLGYRTVCLHPYPASFYQRDIVFPALGFDEFIDIRGFADAAHAGPFVGDLAVADKIRSLLTAQGRAQPLFVFAITMENHGPLHLETVTGDDVARMCNSPPPPGCEDLVVYLRHLANADLMIEGLRACLDSAPGPAGLCFYGDHVPIMAGVYAALGSPDGTTEYALWSNRRPRAPARHPAILRVEQLSTLWLREMGLLNRTRWCSDAVSTPAA